MEADERRGAQWAVDMLLGVLQGGGVVDVDYRSGTYRIVYDGLRYEAADLNDALDKCVSKVGGVCVASHDPARINVALEVLKTEHGNEDLEKEAVSVLRGYLGGGSCG